MTNVESHGENGRKIMLQKAPLSAPKSLPEPDLPQISDADEVGLSGVRKRQQVLRDLALGCIDHHHVGAYIYGPPGTGKTFTIMETLRERKANHRYLQRITAKPLYLEMEKEPDAVIVIDDCEQIFSEKSAQTLLRSALGSDRVSGGRRERRVSYSVSGSRARVMEHYFFGSIIFLANRPLSDEKPEIRAMMSRIPHLLHAPTDSEIRALMRHVARAGHISDSGQMSPSECAEVIEFVIEIASQLQCRLDLRWIDHAYGHYLTQMVSGGLNDWRDMVRFHVMSTITYFEHASSIVAGSELDERRAVDQSQREISIAQQIDATPGLSRDEKLRLWEQRTIPFNPPKGWSRPTYYRRLQAGRTDSASG